MWACWGAPFRPSRSSIGCSCIHDSSLPCTQGRRAGWPRGMWRAEGTGRTEKMEGRNTRNLEAREGGTRVRERGPVLQSCSGILPCAGLQSADWKERAADAPSSAPLARSTHGTHSEGRVIQNGLSPAHSPTQPSPLLQPFSVKTAGIHNWRICKVTYWVPLRSTNPCPCLLRDLSTLEAQGTGRVGIISPWGRTRTDNSTRRYLAGCSSCSSASTLAARLPDCAACLRQIPKHPPVEGCR